MTDLKPRMRGFLDEVWSQGRLDRIATYIGDHYHVRHDPGDPWDGQRLSLEGFVDRVATSRAAAPDQVFTPVEMLQDDRRVAVAWTWTGTHQGDLPGFPASGRAITMSGLTLYSFDGWGKIIGHWQIADRLGVARQLMAEP